MKLFLITLIHFLICLTGYSQSFEGEIIYSNEYTSKVPNVTSQQMKEYLGSVQQYFIKEGYYKSYLNGLSLSYQLYDCKSNRIYNKIPTSDTLYWFDASGKIAEINTWKFQKNIDTLYIQKNVDTFIVIVCDAIIINTKNGVTTFYYNQDYSVNPDYFVDHNYGYWNFFISLSKSLPLKTVIETKQYILESTAIEIKPLKLSNDFFTIPDIPIKSK